MNNAKVLPYVYIATNKNTNQYYIGFRCANKVPSEHDIGVRYFTSSKIVNPNHNEYNFTVIAEFFDKISAIEFEGSLIKERWNDPLLLNKARHTGGTLKHKNYKAVKEINRARMLENNPTKRQDVKDKISAALTGKRHSQETKDKMSATRKGRLFGRRPSQSVRQKGRGNPNSHIFILGSPDNDIVIITEGIKNFCVEHKIPLSGMYELTSAKRHVYKGWICIKKIKVKFT